MKKHLAIFSSDSVKQIFSGSKIIEAWFSKKRILPFGQVSVGDLVYIKPSGKEIAGQFIVKKVLFFEGLDSEDFKLIEQFTGKKMVVGFKFASLIWLDRVEQFITSPIKLDKHDQRGWMILDS